MWTWSTNTCSKTPRSLNGACRPTPPSNAVAALSIRLWATSTLPYSRAGSALCPRWAPVPEADRDAGPPPPPRKRRPTLVRPAGSGRASCVGGGVLACERPYHARHRLGPGGNRLASRRGRGLQDRDRTRRPPLGRRGSGRLSREHALPDATGGYLRSAARREGRAH